MKRLRNASLEERLLHYIKVSPSDCWEWQGGTNNVGYGMIRDGKKMRTTHRTSYELFNHTSVPIDICVYHTCSNYICCNPNHLVTGLRKDVTDYMYLQGHGNAYGGNLPETCVHCNKTMGRNMIKRWHDKNCKLFTDLV